MKLSKSNLPDVPHVEHWHWVESRPKSQHFVVGATVIYNGRRYTLGRPKGSQYVLLRSLDNPEQFVALHRPWFTQWR